MHNCSGNSLAHFFYSHNILQNKEMCLQYIGPVTTSAHRKKKCSFITSQSTGTFICYPESPVRWGFALYFNFQQLCFDLCAPIERLQFKLASFWVPSMCSCVTALSVSGADSCTPETRLPAGSSLLSTALLTAGPLLSANCNASVPIPEMKKEVQHKIACQSPQTLIGWLKKVK